MPVGPRTGLGQAPQTQGQGVRFCHPRARRGPRTEHARDVAPHRDDGVLPLHPPVPPRRGCRQHVHEPKDYDCGIHDQLPQRQAPNRLGPVRLLGAGYVRALVGLAVRRHLGCAGVLGGVRRGRLKPTGRDAEPRAGGPRGCAHQRRSTARRGRVHTFRGVVRGAEWSYDSYDCHHECDPPSSAYAVLRAATVARAGPAAAVACEAAPARASAPCRTPQLRAGAGVGTRGGAPEPAAWPGAR